MKATVSNFKVGQTYAAKKPRKIFLGLSSYWNDRQILWVGTDSIQYDSPTINDGRKYPTTTLEVFRKWAGENVTAKMPEGEWRRTD